jgi:hypothetical protein
MKEVVANEQLVSLRAHTQKQAVTRHISVGLSREIYHAGAAFRSVQGYMHAVRLEQQNRISVELGLPSTVQCR